VLDCVADADYCILQNFLVMWILVTKFS
jgi:hypothetical protein